MPKHPRFRTSATKFFPQGFRQSLVKIRSLPITTGRFNELLWQTPYAIRRRVTRRNLRDLSRWVARRPEFDITTDLKTEHGRRAAEQARLAWIADKVRLGLGWTANAQILEVCGWPIGMRTRSGLGRVSRGELAWLASVAGWRILWEDSPEGRSALMLLPGPSADKLILTVG